MCLLHVGETRAPGTSHHALEEIEWNEWIKFKVLHYQCNITVIRADAGGCSDIKKMIEYLWI